MSKTTLNLRVLASFVRAIVLLNHWNSQRVANKHQECEVLSLSDCTFSLEGGS
jgi:hypothetical protein